MTGEYDDPGFVIDLKTETCTFEGGFVAPITAILDTNGDETLDKQDVRYVVVKMPPEGYFVTVDIWQLREEHIAPTNH
jgi:hypothetical protein